ncbi:hypothetical protein FQN50_003094 [Emmonsiellopsis sp. PD_5]|nr:hypothetical protein FQN50_003094 [Emmonsiellopsis sp. PD_5]
MQLTLPLVAGVLAFVDSAAAHYRWTSLIIDGEVTGEYQYVRSNTNMNSPVTDVMSNDIRCNTGGLESGADTEVATVQAGSTVGFKVDSTLGHPGPVAVYLSASDGDVKAYDGSGAWFKISESGAEITPEAITFPSMDATEYTFEIPAATPPGEYLLRIEHVGLHGASEVGGAQFYISCAQVKIEGTGGGEPGPTTSIPGAYAADDPGLLLSIYWPIPTSYDVPGPEVWTG